MKKMYKKPVTEKVALEPQVKMQAGTLQVSNGGGDNESHNGVIADSPRHP